jgi:glutamate N-acetyltransferase/amino-acid N-acetyltransferase
VVGLCIFLKGNTEMIHAGGITSAKGFKAWGDHVGLKKYKKDLALIVSDVPANVAAVFTTNKAKAAPIQWNEKVLGGVGGNTEDSGGIDAAGSGGIHAAGGNTAGFNTQIKAVLVNSGQANSCTGAQGILNARLMAEKTAVELGCSSSQVLLASTGLIGPQIPIHKALPGIKTVAEKIRADHFAGSAAAEAIITTDSFVKQCATTLVVDSKEITVGAMAKGSGMIHPNMATMLAFLTTDLSIAPALLQKALKESVDISYNMASADGDTSTNDIVIVLANGFAGNATIVDAEDEGYAVFCQALNAINCHLAKKIASDVAGSTKKLAVTVTGAASGEEARIAARKVVSSNLVKAAMYKQDANWGRVIAAVGCAGVEFDMYATTIAYSSEHGTIVAFEGGEQHADFCPVAAASILAAGEVEILISLGAGESAATAWGCDMEYDPIRSSSSGSAGAAVNGKDNSIELTQVLAEVG